MVIDMLHKNALSIILVIFGGVYFSGSAGDGITKEEYKKLFDSIVPKAEERWRKIPWVIDLMEARTLAYQQKKPILLWAMNGHPLGCT